MKKPPPFKPGMFALGFLGAYSVAALILFFTLRESVAGSGTTPRSIPAPDIISDNAGLPLSGIPWQYETTTIRLQPGENILFYTDGVTEARNRDGAFYGAERLRSVVRQASGGVEQRGSAVLADVTRFAAGRSQADDLTLVGFGRIPTS